MRTWGALFVLMLVVGCHTEGKPADARAAHADGPPTRMPDAAVAAVAAPPVDTTCATDADCVGSSVGPDCCPVCKPVVGNKTWAAAAEAACNAHPNPACRPEDCDYISARPRCISGQCTDRY